MINGAEWWTINILNPMPEDPIHTVLLRARYCHCFSKNLGDLKKTIYFANTYQQIVYRQIH